MSLKKIILYRNQSSNQQQTNGFNIFKGKKFYCGQLSKLDKGICCFNHIVGLPVSEKTGLTNPLFDYQRIILNKIFFLEDESDPKNRHVWVKKATGLGITELILRLMLWLCVRDNRYRNSQMCIITGPGIDVALGLIKRMKDIFANINIFIENKETVIDVNGVMIKAFPSNHLSTYRGLTSPKFIFLDEADFIKENEIQEVRDTTERYITKSKPYIVMVSTPNKPDLLFQMIEEEPEDKTIYRRLFFNYQWGIGKMFTEEEVKLQRMSPSFDREYDLKYAGKIGNVFSTHDIEQAIILGEQYKGEEINQYTIHLGGVDPGFGSSKAALYIGEFDTEHQIIRIIEGREYDHEVPSKIADDIFEHHTRISNLKWFIDGSNRGFINEVKVKFGESLRWDTKNSKTHPPLSVQSHTIIPVNFSTEHKQMLYKTFNLLSKGMIAIPRQYDKLITALRTAQATEWVLNKEDTVNDDSLDSLRLLLSSDKAIKIEGDRRQ